MNLNNWCKLNGMILETKKFNVVTYGGRILIDYDYKVDYVSFKLLKVIKDLGIYF